MGYTQRVEPLDPRKYDWPIPEPGSPEEEALPPAETDDDGFFDPLPADFGDEEDPLA